MTLAQEADEYMAYRLLVKNLSTVKSFAYATSVLRNTRSTGHLPLLPVGKIENDLFLITGSVRLKFTIVFADANFALFACHTTPYKA